MIVLVGVGRVVVTTTLVMPEQTVVGAGVEVEFTVVYATEMLGQVLLNGI